MGDIALGKQDVDWIKYNMHLCLAELEYFKDSNEIEVIHDVDGEGLFSKYSQSWIEKKLPKLKSVVAEVNFFSMTTFGSHLQFIQQDYPNIENVYIVLPTEPYLNPAFGTQELLNKCNNSLFNIQYTFNVHLIGFTRPIQKLKLEPLDALRLLDHLMNFYWTIDTFTENDYMNPTDLLLSTWFDPIKEACPILNDEYIIQRLKQNIKIRKNFT